MGIQSLRLTHMQEQQVSESSNLAKALGTQDVMAIQVYIRFQLLKIMTIEVSK